MKKKFQIPKINSVNYGEKWIGIGIMIGLILPGFIWLTLHIFLWWLCIVGGIILASFVVLFSIEMHQDFAQTPYYEKHLKDTIPFNPQKQYAVIRTSICTGEMIAGFKNYEDSQFIEVMVLHSQQEIERFKKIYALEEIKKEY